jgi:hypothetical protein
MRTKEPHVYAIGDIVGGCRHTAGHEESPPSTIVVSRFRLQQPTCDPIAVRRSRRSVDAGQGEGPHRQDAPVPGHRQAIIGGDTRASPRSSPTRRRHAASTSSGRTRRTSSRKRRSPSSSTRRVGDRGSTTHIVGVVGEAACGRSTSRTADGRGEGQRLSSARSGCRTPISSRYRLALACGRRADVDSARRPHPVVTRARAPRSASPGRSDARSIATA